MIYKKMFLEFWGCIIMSGLSEEVKTEIIATNLVPENLPEFRAGRINPEVKAALSAQVLHRDSAFGLHNGSWPNIEFTASKGGGGSEQDLQIILCDYFHSDTKVRKDITKFEYEVT